MFHLDVKDELESVIQSFHLIFCDLKSAGMQASIAGMQASIDC